MDASVPWHSPGWVHGRCANAWHTASENVLKIDSMYYRDGYLYVKGLNTSGKDYYAALDKNGGAIETVSDIVLKETVILPLN